MDMRNLELIQQIYQRLPKMSQREYTIDQLFDRCEDIKDMIESERPELVRNSDSIFWKGGYLEPDATMELPPKTHAEWMEEMKKYPHRDNHMD